MYLAVQCVQCETFQVQQEKKTVNQYSCVVCGQKQKIIKVWHTADKAKDVRPVVMQLNAARGQILQDHPGQDEPGLPATVSTSTDKWAAYLPEKKPSSFDDDGNNGEEEEEEEDGVIVTTNADEFYRTKKQKQRRSSTDNGATASSATGGKLQRRYQPYHKTSTGSNRSSIEAPQLQQQQQPQQQQPSTRSKWSAYVDAEASHSKLHDAHKEGRELEEEEEEEWVNPDDFYSRRG